MHNVGRLVLFLGLIVFPASVAFPAVRASCNANFTACFIPENVLVQLPFTAIAGDVIVQDPSSTGVSDVFRILNNFVDTGGGTGLGSLAILSSRDDNTPLPDPSTYSLNAITIKEAATGSTSYFGNGTTYTLDTSSIPSNLSYTGDTTADYHDPAHLSAILTVKTTGAPIANALVQFTVGSQSCNATTDVSGLASCTLVLNQTSGNYTVTAIFGGIARVNSGTSISHAFVITLEETTLTYTGDVVIANGGTAHLSGVLLEDNVTPIAGRTVVFKLVTGATAQTCNGITDASGKAACTITPVAQPLGPGVVGDSFAGDAFYRPASASASDMVFAFLTSGGFILGDQTAQLGAQETFWGAQWTTVNGLSGGTAPPDFKGFAASLSSEPPRCGISWTSRPGDSSNPPAVVPAYMGVFVSPAVAQSGSTLSGSVPRIVVMKTDPGYVPDPGHPGTGTVVAQVCP
jgi:hypothetical protein